jgi:hypothetical protein
MIALDQDALSDHRLQVICGNLNRTRNPLSAISSTVVIMPPHLA